MSGQLTVRLKDDLEMNVITIARKLNLKRSDIVRIALERFVKSEDEAVDNSPFDKVQHLIGSVDSGIKDLGSAHREHLAQRKSRVRTK